MKIGIDIDDTIAVTVDSMLKYANIYETEILGKESKSYSLGLIHNRYYLQEIFGWDKKTKFDFFDKYYKNVLEECVIMPDAIEIINKLKTEGHKIYFITARITSINGCDTKKITQRMLEENNIQYDELIIDAKNKLPICQKYEVDMFIEDSFETCKELEKIGIKTFLMTSKVNQNIDSGNIHKVNNWNEIYDEIKNIVRDKE